MRLLPAHSGLPSSWLLPACCSPLWLPFAGFSRNQRKPTCERTRFFLNRCRWLRMVDSGSSGIAVRMAPYSWLLARPSRANGPVNASWMATHTRATSRFFKVSLPRPGTRVRFEWVSRKRRVLSSCACSSSARSINVLSRSTLSRRRCAFRRFSSILLRMASISRAEFVRPLSICWY